MGLGLSAKEVTETFDFDKEGAYGLKVFNSASGENYETAVKSFTQGDVTFKDMVNHRLFESGGVYSLRIKKLNSKGTSKGCFTVSVPEGKILKKIVFTAIAAKHYNLRLDTEVKQPGSFDTDYTIWSAGDAKDVKSVKFVGGPNKGDTPAFTKIAVTYDDAPAKVKTKLYLAWFDEKDELITDKTDKKGEYKTEYKIAESGDLVVLKWRKSQTSIGGSTGFDPLAAPAYSAAATNDDQEFVYSDINEDIDPIVQISLNDGDDKVIDIENGSLGLYELLNHQTSGHGTVTASLKDNDLYEADPVVLDVTINKLKATLNLSQQMDYQWESNGMILEDFFNVTESKSVNAGDFAVSEIKPLFEAEYIKDGEDESTYTYPEDHALYPGHKKDAYYRDLDLENVIVDANESDPASGHVMVDFPCSGLYRVTMDFADQKYRNNPNIETNAPVSVDLNIMPSYRGLTFNWRPVTLNGNSGSHTITMDTPDNMHVNLDSHFTDLYYKVENVVKNAHALSAEAPESEADLIAQGYTHYEYPKLLDISSMGKTEGSTAKVTMVLKKNNAHNHYTAPTTVLLTRSNVETGIDMIGDAENVATRWYRLDGTEADGSNLAPGLYIRVNGNESSKVMIR